MRVLFEIGEKGVEPTGISFVRPSARCIAVRDGKVAMVHSAKYDYYKFPGGGIEPGETPVQAMIRETLEEAGLVVVTSTIREYGLVHRVDRRNLPGEDYFVQDNFYFLCDVEETVWPQKLDDYEDEEGFALEYVAPERAIWVNRTVDHGPKSQTMVEREARVLELMMAEGIV